MSSPQTSPVHDSHQSTVPDSASQTQRQPVPSSPLFIAPSSDDSARPSQTQGSRQRYGSSPIPFTSSDLGHDLNSQLVRRGHHSRGDVHSSDIMSSPMRRRFFDNSNPQPSLMSDSQLPSESQLSSVQQLSDSGSVNPDEPVRVIWGTNVSIQECSDNFRTFLMSFKMKYRRKLDEAESDDPADDSLYYVKILNDMRESGTTNLNLDTRNLLAYSTTKKLYYQLINYPQEVIPIMDQTIKDCMVSLVLDNSSNADPQDQLVDEIESNVYKVRPFNIQNQRGMRELNPIDIDKLVTVKGLVIRSTPIIPDMKIAFFKCNVCDHTVVVENDRGVIQEPTKCPRQICSSQNSMQLVHNRSSFADKQAIKLQETPDNVPDGQTPHSISLCVYDELVDATRAGDRVEVCGIFKSIPVKVNARQRAVKSLFKTYIDVVHIKKVDKHRLGADVSTLENELKEQQEVDEVRKLSEDEIAKIKEIAKRDDVYELLARSLAPSIFEMSDVKKGILLQLFGGTNKKFAKGGKYRGDINILLCGDPSTSKSQILQYVHKIAPRGIYTSGKGSSAVGLTAYVTRDIETKQLVLESGALVLSDGGVCCIDEFDKMSESTRSVLHEVMEQQTISIAKAGIITTLNARTSILASANPIESRYNPNLPVTKNIDLPPPLLSRFDLVYLILDKVDEKIDTQLARHIAGMFLEDSIQTATSNEILPIELLSSYIQYAKENVSPVLTEEAKNQLVKAYVEMRKLGEDVRSAEKRITATTRQLESMIRLSEAHAKMRLSPVVELEDVDEAVRLTKSAIKDYATDPLTGRIDMDLVNTGQTSAERKMKEDLSKQVFNLLDANGSLTYDVLLHRINEQSSAKVENLDLSEVLRRLEAENRVTVFGQGHKREIRVNRGVV
ncbi:hypothetical protein KL930_001085 [Ogataea haglerorum]|uniref:DNA replication licensing factor MCM4 n=1 Tax=Ogataea haglerorum TaxID=1937702 RepID=A0AAN6I2D1_9ASCO|nr:uncharacterized protein KL911_001294 [Ogataea haglerorum]KAG7700397.1 hypothetical protein KL915_001086 [Ogataea haglerorum]KAG7702056.1 hypothetical protein KL951_000512 [Ogataea haglerorum]KAG7711870.1 hypothetical protein KL914_000512 [Ogataea haglerorum]KAG7712641.1 hypothetical protein KL950_000512 [Ogataea haglerorum]KAG7722691.1 hypothetical protein KL913_000511 [Ogataea haglerorum]